MLRRFDRLGRYLLIRCKRYRDIFAPRNVPKPAIAHNVMRKLIAMGFLFGLLVWAADTVNVTGKWVGEAPGRGGQTREVTFNLKADGENLTGTVSGPRGDTEIAEGKIAGDTISFSQSMEFGGNQVKLLYTGKVSGDQIEFTRARDGGEGHSQTFIAKRAQ